MYGTLLFQEVLGVLGLKLEFMGEAVLKGWSRRSLRDRRYPAVVKAAAGSVRGKLLCCPNEKTLECLDHYEGEEYQRRKLAVQKDGVDMEAWVYTLKEVHLPWVDGDWNPEVFRRSHLEGYLNECIRWSKADGG